jgi:anaerobic magnesium-protoporphyrin IX monomethyl ester cyclase
MQPLGLASIASAIVEMGHEVVVCDAWSFGLGEEAIREFLIREKPDVVGTTATTPYIYDAWAIHKIAKELNPNVFTINGGPHASHIPEDVAKDEHTDIAVVGEGEYIFGEVLEATDSREFGSIRGIAYKDANGRVKRNPNRTPNFHLDSLPFPGLDLFPSVIISPRWGLNRGKFAPICTTRGCPYNCEFCSITAYQGTKYRYRSVDSVIEELKMLKEVHGVSMTSFREGVATLRKTRMKEICQRMIDENLNMTWTCTATISSADPEMFKLMKEAGCTTVEYGLETGSQVVLDANPYLKVKNFSIEEMAKVVRMTDEAGIEVHGYFITGLPGETRETVQETIDFARSLPISTAGFTIAIPFPGTELYEYYKSRDRLLDKPWYEFHPGYGVVIDHENLSEAELLELNQRAWRKSYLRPSQILRRLKAVRSWKDLWVNIDLGYRFVLARTVSARR